MQIARKYPPTNPRDVIADPAPYSDVPTLYAEAWFELKAARGQAVDYPRAALVGPPRHHVAHPVPTPDPEPTVAEVVDRCAGQARKIALAKGIIGEGNAA